MILPGQSLTAEPKAAPYENPPQYTNPEDAIEFHLDRLTEEDRMDALVDALELDMSVVDLTEGLLRGAVMDGRHSIDVSLLIAPIVHEFIRTTAEKAGVDFTEFNDDGDEKKRADVRYQINSKKAAKILEDYQEDGVVDTPIEDNEEGVVQEDAPLMARPDKGAGDEGLMSRMARLKGDDQ